MRKRFERVAFESIWLFVFLLVATNCKAESSNQSNQLAPLIYKASSGVLPESNEHWPFVAAPTGTATIKDRTSPLITSDSDDKADGRYYWLTRDAIRQVLDGRDELTLSVVCDATVSSGHIAATSVRLFVPGGGFELSPLRKDVHRAGYQDVLEAGHQVGFSLVSDGKNHDADEVVLLDFGPNGPHRELGHIRIPINEPRKYTISIRSVSESPSDRLVVLTAEGATPESVSVKLSELSPIETATDFGLVFGHLTGPGVAEVKWSRIELEPVGHKTQRVTIDQDLAPREIGKQRQLFVDDWLIAGTDGVTRRQGKTVKSRKNPVLRRDRPWEASRCELYGSSIWIPQQNKLQLFYSAMKQPYDSRVAYAESDDFGVTWNKPGLNVFPWEGQPSNIVWPGRYWAHGPTVLFDEHETDPNKRYKLLVTAAALNPELMDQGIRGIDAAFSPDGIHWTPAPNNPVIADFVSDTGNCVIWDARKNIYRTYVRLRTNTGRAVGLTESKDFLNWSEPRLIFWPSANDRKVSNEFYGLSVTPYGDLYLGLAWMFPSTPASADMQSDTPVTWPELSVSRDGEQWNRPFEGQPFLPLGPKGTFDARQIRPASTMAILPDRIVIMYSGSPHAHVAGHQWDIGLANLRIDGFASMDAGNEEGRLTTKPLVFPAGRLFVNAVVDAGGYIRVEAVDEKDQPVAEYAASQCEGVKMDSREQQVTWKNRDSLEVAPPSGTRLRFIMKNAKLYSFWLDPSPRSAAR